MTTINSKEMLNPSKCRHRGRGRDKLAHLEKVGLGSTLSFFSFQLSPHLNLHRIKGFGEEMCEKMNNVPKDIICTPLKKEVLIWYNKLVVFCQ